MNNSFLFLPILSFSSRPRKSDCISLPVKLKSKAFIKAWEHICAADGRLPTFYIPPGKTFLLGQVQFKGPCKASSVHVRVTDNL